MSIEIHAAWAAPCAAAVVAAGVGAHRRGFAWMPSSAASERDELQRPRAPIAGLLLLPSILVWQLVHADGYALPAVTAALAISGHLDDRRAARGESPTQLRAFALAVATAALAAMHSSCELSFAFASAWLLAFALVRATRMLDVGNGVCVAVAAGSLLGNEWMIGAEVRWQAFVGWAALGLFPWNWPRPRVALGASGANALGVCVAEAALGNLPFRLLSSSTNAVQVERVWEHGMLAALLLLPFVVQLVVFADGVVARTRSLVSPSRGIGSLTARVARALRLPAVLWAPLLGVVAFALVRCCAAMLSIAG